MKLSHLFAILAIAGFPILAEANTAPPHTVSITYTVNSVADSVDTNPGDGVCMDASGQCSLRAAIMEANAHFGPDTIVFDPITDGQPQLLQLHGAGEDAGATGDLDITEDLTITGNGTDKTIIDGDAADRVFDVHPASGTMTVEIDDLAIQNGNAVDLGGGIRVQNSTLILNSDLVTENEATNVSGTAYGGGIYATQANLTLDNTMVKNNAVGSNYRAGGGGIAAINSSVTHILDGSIVIGNVVYGGPNNDADGGGIYSTSSMLSIDSSAIRGNEANNTNANEPAYGGGIETDTGSYTITNSEISGNIADGDAFAFGGGLDAEYSGSNSTIVDTTITGNSAVANSTSGSAYGGGVSIDSTPSGITELLGNVTVSANSVQGIGTGGGGVDVYQNAGTVSVQNSIVAGNQDSNAAAPDCVGSFGGTLSSGGYNLIGDGTGCTFSNATGDQIGTGTAPIDPMLGALADNGGKTQTMALLAGSPAVDTGNPAGCSNGAGGTLTRDQRNLPRPEDGNASGTAVCDIGAYERAADNPPNASDSSLTLTKNQSTTGTLMASDSDGDALVFAIVTQPAHGSVTLDNAATGAFTYTPNQGYTGSDSFTFNVNDGFVDSNTATESFTIKAGTTGSSGGGGGSLGLFALFSLLVLALVPRLLRRRGTRFNINQLREYRPMKHRYLVVAFSALALGTVLSATPALAAPGDLDSTFNGGVPVIEDDNTEFVDLEAFASAVNPLNNDIVWVGYASVGGGAGTIYAYKPDGSPDTGFGAGGFQGLLQLTADQAGVSGGDLNLFATAVDSQGRILAAGLAENSNERAMVLARFEPDGTLDTGFGTAGTGIVTDALNTFAEGSGLALTSDGHILVVGLAANAAVTEGLLTVWRFNPDGTADTGFGDSGHVQIDAINVDNESLCLFTFSALQTDGSLITGCQDTTGGGPWMLTRLLPDGSVDNAFGASGFITGNANMRLVGLALAPDGGFVISELDPSTSPPPIDLRRYLSDGSMDSGFNGGNPLDFGTLPGPSIMLPLAIQPDGKILASGSGGGNSLVVARLLADGTLDSSFGNQSAGISAIDFNNINGNNYTPGATALVMQGDGKIIASGLANSSAGSSLAAFVTRLDNDTFNVTPDAFSFMDQTNVGLSTTITSNAISVSGLSTGASVPVSVSGGEYMVNSGPWTTAPGLVQNGDQVAVRHTSSGSYSTSTTTTLSIGGQAIPNNYDTVLGSATTATFTSTTKAQSSGGGGSGGGGGGGGGNLGLFALLALLLLPLSGWWLRRTRYTRIQPGRMLR